MLSQGQFLGYEEGVGTKMLRRAFHSQGSGGQRSGVWGQRSGVRGQGSGLGVRGQNRGHKLM